MIMLRRKIKQYKKRKRDTGCYLKYGGQEKPLRGGGAIWAETWMK